MPGSNAGTGHPYTFRCAKCKTNMAFVLFGMGGMRDPKRGTNWFATGTVIGDLDKASPHVRVNRHVKAEYECRDCGHKGFSGHSMVLAAARLLRKLGPQKRR